MQNTQQVRTQLRKELGFAGLRSFVFFLFNRSRSHVSLIISDLKLVSQFDLPLFCKCLPIDAQDPTEVTTLNLSDCGLASLPDKIGLRFFLFYYYYYLSSISMFLNALSAYLLQLLLSM